MEEEKSRIPRNIEISDIGKIIVYSHLTLEEVMLSMAQRLHENGHRGVHCFLIDRNWVREGSEGRRVTLPDGRIGITEPDTISHMIWEQRELFRFMDAPVYIIDEVNAGQYDIYDSGMGYKGVVAVPL